MMNDEWGDFCVVGLQPTIEGARLHRVGRVAPVMINYK